MFRGVTHLQYVKSLSQSYTSQELTNMYVDLSRQILCTQSASFISVRRLRFMRLSKRYCLNFLTIQ